MVTRVGVCIHTEHHLVVSYIILCMYYVLYPWLREWVTYRASSCSLLYYMNVLCIVSMVTRVGDIQSVIL